MMSIALSAVIRPSKVLSAMVALQCLLAGSIGILIAIGAVGNLPLPERLALAGLCLFAAMYGITRYYRSRQAVQIDISGSGRIRIAEMATAQVLPAAKQIPSTAKLLEGTTLWSHLLLLRLRLDSGSVRTIAILPDCVSNDTFRNLSVACRWIASRTNKTGSAGLNNE
ncbi:flagellar hook-length control protein [Collimonas silvisoli]|uniref:flagellar hook-length control protein n=1 Tax=Collimonas silvisoli TaxID=2825884 RepID=UPI001B8B5CAC|nr:flagellar hook-length control protein [Collimonas silvisoli]